MDEARKRALIERYGELAKAKDVLMEKMRQGHMKLEEIGQLAKLNEEQYEIVAQMIDMQLIQIHISEE